MSSLLLGLALAMGLGWSLRLQRRLELVARADHELRGPLTAARLALHGLTRTAGGAAPSSVAALDLELCRATLALGDLTAARAGRRPAGRAEVVDVAALTTSAEPTWRALAELFGAELRVAPPPSGALVRIERLRLAQALGNLIANAAEHGGGRVTVRIEATAGRARIVIADDGPGLAALPRTRERRPALAAVPGLGRGRSFAAAASPSPARGRNAAARSSNGRGPAFAAPGLPGRWRGSTAAPGGHRGLAFAALALPGRWRGTSAAPSRGRGLAIAQSAIQEAGGVLRRLPAEHGTQLAVELPLVGAGAVQPASEASLPAQRQEALR